MGARCSKQRHKPKISRQQIPWLLRGAIRSNNVETLQYLLSYPNDVDPSMVIGGVCPLNLAIELGHLQMVKILIKAGADIHVPDAPRNPLLQAAMYGRAEISELLIKSGCSINIRNERNESALHLLCHQTSDRYIKCAEVLLQNGIDPNTIDENGLAPLHKSSAEIARTITLSEKSDLNLSSRDGDSPLTAAIKDRRHTFVTTLIKAAAEADQRAAIAAAEADQRAAIAAAIFAHAQTLQPSPPTTRHSMRSNTSGSIKEGSNSTSSSSSNHSSRRLRILPMLTVTSSNRSGSSSKIGRATANRSSLNNGIKNGDTLKDAVVSKSISHGSFAQPNIMSRICDNLTADSFTNFTDSTHNPPPSSPLPMVIIRSTSSPPLRLNLEKADKIGMSPLMIAADAGQAGLGMVTALVASGCELQTSDKMGMTALHYACYVGSLMTVQFLYEVALERGNNMINLQDKFGRSPIYLATCRGHSDVVDYLLAKGADLHLPNKEMKTPLYNAANFGHLEIVNALLRHGAEVDQADSHNKTPLYVATYHGRGEIVDLLLRSNASVNTPDKNGRTALYIAVLHGHIHIARRLIDVGASVNKPDKDGLAPLHMAVKFPKLDFPMVKLLLSSGCDPLNLSNFTNWLLHNNIITQDVLMRDPELYEWLKRDEFNVRSLKRLCRNEIQKTLGHTDSLKSKISNLTLPPNLQTYVSMKAL